MDIIINFIHYNWSAMLIIAVLLSFILFLVWNKKWDQLREIAYKLMLKAEMTIVGSKRGQERFDYVFDKIYSLIPLWLQSFFSPEDVKKKLQEWFHIVKDELDDGKVNNSLS